MKARISSLFRKALASEHIGHQSDTNQLSPDENKTIAELAALEELLGKQGKPAISEEAAKNLQYRVMQRIREQSPAQGRGRFSLSSLPRQFRTPMGQVASFVTVLLACLLLVLQFSRRELEHRQAADMKTPLAQASPMLTESAAAQACDAALATDWQYILISRHTCYFLDLPELRPLPELPERNNHSHLNHRRYGGFNDA